jgi:NitT/TauT family transport system permease protein
MSRTTNLALTLLVFAATMLTAEIAIRLAEIPPFILPTPSSVAAALWKGLTNGVYVRHLAVTLSETVLGFLIGAVLGLGVGTLVALNRYVDLLAYPYVVAFQSLPKVALAPIIAVWFGLGMTSKVVNAALVAFFPLLVNVIAGLRSTDEDRLDLMRSLGATETQIFWKVRLPSALPFIIAGVDIAIVFSLIGAIVGEFVGANAGLGYLIRTYEMQLDVSGSFSILIILAATGLALHKTVMAVRRRVLFWDPSERTAADRQVTI